MLNASPKKVGTISGSKLGTHPKRTKMIYRGMTVTWKGSIMVAMMNQKVTWRPFQRIRAKA